MTNRDGRKWPTAELRDQPPETITAPTLIISAPGDLYNTLPAAEFAVLASRVRTGG